MKRCIPLMLFFLLVGLFGGCRSAARSTPAPTPARTPITAFITLEPELSLPSETPEPSATPQRTRIGAAGGAAKTCPQTSLDQAKYAIRTLVDMPDLPLTYRETISSLYNHTHQLLVLEDGAINEYQVDCASGMVVEVIRHTAADFTLGDKTPEELEQIAQLTIQRGAPDLDLSKLTPKPSSKETNFFFRWEGTPKQILTDPPGGMVAFVEVLLTTNGTLAHYFNMFPLLQ